MTKKRKRYSHRRKRRFSLPRPSACKICDLPDDLRNVYRFLLLKICENYPHELWKGVGLEGTLEIMESMAEKGLIKIGEYKPKNAPPGREDESFYCLLLWDFFLCKYVMASKCSNQFISLCEYWLQNYN